MLQKDNRVLMEDNTKLKKDIAKLTLALKEEKWKVKQLFKDANELRIELGKELAELSKQREEVI